MQIEIRSSGDADRCETCGAGRQLFVPTSNAAFELEFDARIDETLGGTSWWRIGKKRQIKKVKALKDQLASELREATRYV